MRSNVLEKVWVIFSSRIYEFIFHVERSFHDEADFLLPRMDDRLEKLQRSQIPWYFTLRE